MTNERTSSKIEEIASTVSGAIMGVGITSVALYEPVLGVGVGATAVCAVGVGDYKPSKQNIYRGLAAATIGIAGVLSGNCIRGANERITKVNCSQTPVEQVITIGDRQGEETFIRTDGDFMPLDAYLQGIDSAFQSVYTDKSSSEIQAIRQRISSATTQPAN